MGKLNGKSADEIRQALMRDGSQLAAFKIIQKDVLTDTEVNLHISDGSQRGTQVIAFQKLGNDWKFAGEGH